MTVQLLYLQGGYIKVLGKWSKMIVFENGVLLRLKNEHDITPHALTLNYGGSQCGQYTHCLRVQLYGKLKPSQLYLFTIFH